jgi:hypothetical protein
MGQGLKEAVYTYSQFTDLVFRPLPKTSKTLPFSSLIGTYKGGGFSPFIDDHIGGFRDFNSQFTFLHEEYFLQIVFEPVYLS